MGRRPLCTYETAHRRTEARETMMQAAEAAWRSERDAGHKTTKAQVAAEFCVPRTTLSARLGGRRSIAEVGKDKRPKKLP